MVRSKTKISDREQARREKQRGARSSVIAPLLNEEPPAPVTDDVDHKSAVGLNRALDPRPPSHLNDPLQLVSKKQLASLLGVHVWTIDNWRRRGAIPKPICLSPQIVAWRRVDIDRWLAQREVQTLQTRQSPNPKAKTSSGT
jgi:predicted DNA-binding transcriptional regulator AlpA